MKKCVILVFIVVCLVCLFFCGSLFRTEILTKMHEDELINSYCNYDNYTYWIDEGYNAKIIEYGSNYAEVYYFTDFMGIYVIYLKVNGEWIPSSEHPNIIWSESGNADRLIWPYWYHIFYFVL